MAASSLVWCFVDGLIAGWIPFVVCIVKHRFVGCWLVALLCLLCLLLALACIASLFCCD